MKIMKNAYTFSTKDIMRHAMSHEQPYVAMYPMARLVQDGRGISYAQAVEACEKERIPQEMLTARIRFIAALTGMSPEQLEHYKNEDSEPGPLYTANVVLDTYDRYMAPTPEKHAIFSFLSSLLTKGVTMAIARQTGGSHVKG